jgi:hypothetical protein
MIPNYHDNGYLPPGIHRATVAGIAVRFGRESGLCQAQMESQRWLVDRAKKAEYSGPSGAGAGDVGKADCGRPWRVS